MIKMTFTTAILLVLTGHSSHPHQHIPAVWRCALGHQLDFSLTGDLVAYQAVPANMILWKIQFPVRHNRSQPSNKCTNYTQAQVKQHAEGCEPPTLTSVQPAVDRIMIHITKGQQVAQNQDTPPLPPQLHMATPQHTHTSDN